MFPYDSQVPSYSNRCRHYSVIKYLSYNNNDICQIIVLVICQSTMLMVQLQNECLDIHEGIEPSGTVINALMIQRYRNVSLQITDNFLYTMHMQLKKRSQTRHHWAPRRVRNPICYFG